MDVSRYDALRQFADSWGLLYMMTIFVIVVLMLILPGARERANEAARIPLDDTHPAEGNDRK